MTVELFKKNNCPCCRKVMNFIAESGREDIVFRDISKSEEEAGSV